MLRAVFDVVSLTIAQAAIVRIAEGARLQFADAVTVEVVQALVFRRVVHGVNIHGARVSGNRNK